MQTVCIQLIQKVLDEKNIENYYKKALELINGGIKRYY